MAYKQGRGGTVTISNCTFAVDNFTVEWYSEPGLYGGFSISELWKIILDDLGDRELYIMCDTVAILEEINRRLDDV